MNAGERSPPQRQLVANDRPRHNAHRRLGGLAARRGRLGAPALAWICALVGFANAFAWSLLTPPFQVPDETNHYAYAEYFAETGQLPHQLPLPVWSPQETIAISALNVNGTVGYPVDGRPPLSSAEAAAASASVAAQPDRLGAGGQTDVTNSPPLYYIAEAGVYRLFGAGSLFDRLEAMRAFSAILTGATILFVFLFLSELVPERPRFVAAATLVCAFQPLLGFIGGGISNDALFFTFGALLLYALACCHRRGLSRSTGRLVGAALGLGLVTKLSFLGLVPGVLVALLLLINHASRGEGRVRARAGAGWALLFATAPVGLYLVLNATVWGRPVWEGAGGAATLTGTASGARLQGNFRELLSYIWQVYLPRLPFQLDQFPGIVPPWDIWIKGFIGRFGWLDTAFPGWGYDVGAGVLSALALLAIGGAVRARAAMLRRRREVVSLLALTLGLMVTIARAGFPYHLQTGLIFEQARYLLPLMGLYGLVILLALRGLGGRLGTPAAAFVVAVAIGHDLLSQIVTLGRYYT